MSMISVLMSVYNEPLNYIDEAINSILNQTYKDFEYIIVVDKPDNLEIIHYLNEKAKRDSRIKVLVNKKNIGLAMSLNRAIEKAGGKYLARMDADDIALPERFDKELKYLKKNKLDMVATATNKIDDSGLKWGEIHPFSTRLDDIKEFLKYQNIIVHPTVMMKAEAINDLGGYRNFSSCQDYDLWLRFITARYKIGILDEILLSFRRHSNSISATCRFSQILNESYIRKLYVERIKNNGIDNFSELNLHQYLESCGFYDKIIFKRENLRLSKYVQGIKLLKTGDILKGLGLCISSMCSKYIRYDFKLKFMVKRVKLRLKNRG